MAPLSSVARLASGFHLLVLWVLLGLLHLVTFASSCLENAFGPYPLSASSAWHPFWDQDDVQDMIDDVPVAPQCLD